VADVGGDREGRRESVADERGVHEQPVAPAVHVGEQPSVAVAGLRVEAQAHALAVDEAAVGGAGRLAEALDRDTRLDRLGRVHPDVANGLVASPNARMDRVAVHDAGDGRR
jgi:hypothetical protein